MATGFFGNRQGAVQTDYNDNPTDGYPGSITTAADVELIDAFPVGGSANIVAGLGVMEGAAIGAPSGAPNRQAAPFQVLPVGATTTLANFAGIAVRTDGMSTDNTGIPVYEPDEMASVMRDYRSGGRIFADAPVAVTANQGVHMYIQNTTSHGRAIGSFTNAAAGADTLDLSAIAVWAQAAAANSSGVIEFRRSRT